MNKVLIIIAAIVILLVFLFGFRKETPLISPSWPRFLSIDTMKYSRDLSREKLGDTLFDSVIDIQVKNIANTGATHVAIATPYDEEFYPMLKRWVLAARKYNLKVWFRGNWSGWEGWFDYPKITRAEHTRKIEEFITKHKDIFIDGDIFTACPECENGGPGDPRQTGDIAGFRKFLINEYNVTKSLFKIINKNVGSNFNSMNGDVARAVMDKQTTSALNGIVTIDHYVATPEKLLSDIREISRTSGGKIVLGEFGAPIPDINGDMDESEQAAWISKALRLLLSSETVVGINYWTNIGSSTALWNEDNTPKAAVGVIRSIFSQADIIR